MCKLGHVTFAREREVEVGDVVVVYEEERKRGEKKMGVVERLVTGPRDNVVRGATVRVISKENRFAFPNQFKTFIRWSFGAKGRKYKHLQNATAIQKLRQEESVLEMRP